MNKTSTVGLFFGSFNPIHIGHLAIANYLKAFYPLKEVWFVVSPHNPLKDKKSLLDQYQRLHMVNLAISDCDFLKASDIEFKLSLPSYTVNTLVYLKETFPKKTFALIMGADNLQSIKKWKNYEYILENQKIFVYPRPGIEIPQEYQNHKNITITDAPIMDISSSFIRKSISNKKDVRYFLPQTVYDYICEMNFYIK